MLRVKHVFASYYSWRAYLESNNVDALMVPQWVYFVRTRCGRCGLGDDPKGFGPSKITPPNRK